MVCAQVRCVGCCRYLSTKRGCKCAISGPCRIYGSAPCFLFEEWASYQVCASHVAPSIPKLIGFGAGKLSFPWNLVFAVRKEQPVLEQLFTVSAAPLLFARCNSQPAAERAAFDGKLFRQCFPHPGWRARWSARKICVWEAEEIFC